MNSDELKKTIETASWVAIAVATIGCALLANVMEIRRHAGAPDAKPYWWGYFFGALEMFCGLIAPISGGAAVLYYGDQQWGLFFGAFGFTVLFILNSIFGWFIFRRKRWAWIAATISNPNIILWLINYFYVRNRWKELS